jgi:hypothetical protein
MLLHRNNVLLSKEKMLHSRNSYIFFELFTSVKTSAVTHFVHDQAVAIPIECMQLACQHLCKFNAKWKVVYLSLLTPF